MIAVGVWQVDNERVARIAPASLRLERELEEWIERDPSLLAYGLEIVGRQVHVEAGIIDLLALDPQGRRVVVEIKRGVLRRETVAQAIDYASCIAKMGLRELEGKVELKGALRDRIHREWADGKDPEVTVYVVGTGQDPSLERVLGFWGQKANVLVNTVLFDVFEFGSGHRILLRQLTREDEPTQPPKDRRVKELFEVAKRNGLGEAFASLMGVAGRHGFSTRGYKHSIMFAPPSNRTICLFVADVIPTADHLLKLYVAPEAFEEFYPNKVEKGTAVKELGDEGWRQLTAAKVEEFCGSLDRLMSSAEEKSTSQS